MGKLYFVLRLLVPTSENLTT